MKHDYEMSDYKMLDEVDPKPVETENRNSTESTNSTLEFILRAANETHETSQPTNQTSDTHVY